MSIIIPLASISCASCGKPLQSSGRRDGISHNEVQCANCGAIVTICAFGGGTSENCNHGGGGGDGRFSTDGNHTFT